MSLGKRITDYRKALNMTQEDLADQLGVSRQSIYKWESDASIPDTANLIELSKVFEVELEVLIGTKKAEVKSKRELTSLSKIVMVIVIFAMWLWVAGISRLVNELNLTVSHLNFTISNLRSELDYSNGWNGEAISDEFFHQSVTLKKLNYEAVTVSFEVEFSLRVEQKILAFN